MSKSIALSLLAQGNTGSEILSILDALVADNLSLIDGHHRTESLIDSTLTLKEIAF